MKRKDVIEADDDFFDFTLSSPALKIRRLDADFAPVMDEEETLNQVVFEKSMPFQDTVVEQSMEATPVAIDKLSSSVPVNEERAIVMFDPKNNMHSAHSPPPFSICADSGFLSGFKNPVIWSNQLNKPRMLVGETQKQDDNSGLNNGCLAVVPWVPSHSEHPPIAEVDVPGEHISEMMDADVMDVEDDYNSQQVPKVEWGATSVSQGLNHRPQHCMIQQPPSNLTSPITWFGRAA